MTRQLFSWRQQVWCSKVHQHVRQTFANNESVQIHYFTSLMNIFLIFFSSSSTKLWWQLIKLMKIIF